MSTSPMDPINNILAGLTHLEDDLPSLVGEEGWAAIGETLYTQVEQLRHSTDSGERLRLANMLVKMIWTYPDARERLRAEIHIQAALRNEMELDLVAFANEMSVDVSLIEPSVTAALQSVSGELAELGESESETRVLTLKPGGLGEGKTIKFRNLDLDFGEMSELAAGVILTSHGILEKPHPLIIAAGILLTIRSLMKTITVKLSELETSVFWGFIQARGKDNTADEAVIAKHTNEEREKVGLKPLTDKQIKNALHGLRSLKSVEAVKGKPGIWRIIEKYKIKD